MSKKYRLPALAALVASVVVLLVVAILAFANASAINRQLHAWKLLPEPERLTELYYENHTKLPVAYAPGSPQSFSFTVHNLEYRTVRYNYTITQSAENGTNSQTATSGTFTLPQDGYRTQPITVIPTDMGNRSQITAVVKDAEDAKGDPSADESIHYWVTKQ